MSCIKEDACKQRAMREEQQDSILLKTKQISASDTECLRIKNKVIYSLK